MNFNMHESVDKRVYFLDSLITFMLIISEMWRTNFSNTWILEIILKWVCIYMNENNLLYYLHPRFTAKIILWLY